MESVKVYLNEISKLKEYLSIVEKSSDMLYATDASGCKVNAKGILGLMSLDLREPITLLTEDDNVSPIELFPEIRRFVVN